MADDATDIPVIDQHEAALRVQSGGYDAQGNPAGPAMVDTATPAPSGAPPVPPTAVAPENKGWAVSNDEVNANIGAKPILPPQADVPAPQEPMPSGLEFTVATLERNNFISAAYNRFINHPDATAPDVPGYNPYDNNGIAGYEDHATMFADANSPQQTQVIKERIDDARNADKIIARVGAQGLASTMAASMLDPISLTMMLVPGLGEVAGVSRLARVGAVIGTNVAAGEAQQAALTSMTGDKYTDNMLPRIASNALLAGVLGTLATRVPKAEFNDLTRSADSAINGTKEPTTAFYHSSPAEFTQFDHSKIGTGEGNQSFSHGIYGAENPDVAKSYSTIAENKGTESNLYKFEVKNSDIKGMLDWDKPLSEQPEILKALDVDPNAPPKLNGIDPAWSGQQLHDNLLNGKTNLGAPDDKAKLAEWLTNKGVKGVSYLDAGSRGLEGDGTRNVVLYKGTDADITHRNGTQINGEPAVPTESTGGAAAVRGTTLEQESFAKGGNWVARADAALPRWLASPTLRVMSTSPVVESRRLIQRLVDVGGGMLNKNKQGIATPTSVEMVTNQMVNSREAQIFRGVDDLFAEHAKEAGANALSKHDFGAQILQALSNGDKHDVPQVMKAAKIVRPFFDADHAELRKIAPDADYAILQKTAESYAPRVWDINKITADRTSFEQFLQQHFTNNPKTVPVPDNTVKVAPAKIGEGSSKTFIDDFHQQFPDTPETGYAGKRVGKANVDVSSDPFDPNKVHLEMLRADEPGKKQGRRALEKVLALADKHGVTVQLDAVPVGKNGPDTAKLMEFYREHGFKPPAEPAGPTTMVRPGLKDRLAGNVAERAKLETNSPAIDEAPVKGTTSVASQEHIGKLKEVDAENKRILKEHEAAQPVQEIKQEGVGPPKPIFRDPAEVKAAVQDTIDNIQHAVRGTADVGSGVRNPRSAKARTLDVSDNAARPWLSDDFEGTMKAYLRTMVPHIEMHRQFGSITLENEIQQISDAYRVKMAAAGSNDAAKAKLVAQRESDVQDMILERDRLLGQAGPRNNESQAVVRVAQIARSVNYVRSLGSQLFSAIEDIGRVASRYGLTNTAQRTAQFALSSELRNMAKADMQRIGTALDVVLHTREHSLEGTSGLIDTGDRLNRFAQNATAKFTKYSMIAHWDASIRLLSAQLEQDAMARLVKGENISAFEKAKLAAHGIGDDDLGAIREQWNTHGSNEGGLNRARTELWSDQDAAQKVEQAIQRAASTNAFFIGKGDVPGFADTQTGKFMFQFKGFVMGSVARLVLPLAQGLAHGDVKAANGLAMMLGLGGLTYYLKERAAGREPDMSPGSLGPEMLQRSGVLAFLPDLYDPMAAVVHLPRFSKFKDHGWQETLGGPTVGMIPILGKLVEDATGGKFTAQDLHKVRQLLPYQNMFYLNRLFNMAEGKTADALDLKNALNRPALDYLNPAKDTDAIEPEADKQHFLGIQAIPNKF